MIGWLLFTGVLVLFVLALTAEADAAGTEADTAQAQREADAWRAARIESDADVRLGSVLYAFLIADRREPGALATAAGALVAGGALQVRSRGSHGARLTATGLPLPAGCGTVEERLLRAVESAGDVGNVHDLPGVRELTAGLDDSPLTCLYLSPHQEFPTEARRRTRWGPVVAATAVPVAVAAVVLQAWIPAALTLALGAFLLRRPSGTATVRRAPRRTAAARLVQLQAQERHKQLDPGLRDPGRRYTAAEAGWAVAVFGEPALALVDPLLPRVALPPQYDPPMGPGE
ncbi:hypothetical protein [Kitasatospora sp. NPDC057015]|uniref:hypothetical protein n=1 Tax=Kitasatospora sp. NPDC057015 TaxID=3346001 RepID=UPI00363CD495